MPAPARIPEEPVRGPSGGAGTETARSEAPRPAERLAPAQEQAGTSLRASVEGRAPEPSVRQGPPPGSTGAQMSQGSGGADSGSGSSRQGSREAQQFSRRNTVDAPVTRVPAVESGRSSDVFQSSRSYLGTTGNRMSELSELRARLDAVERTPVPEVPVPQRSVQLRPGLEEPLRPPGQPPVAQAPGERAPQRGEPRSEVRAEARGSNSGVVDPIEARLPRPLQPPRTLPPEPQRSVPQTESGAQRGPRHYLEDEDQPAGGISSARQSVAVNRHVGEVRSQQRVEEAPRQQLIVEPGEAHTNDGGGGDQGQSQGDQQQHDDTPRETRAGRQDGATAATQATANDTQQVVKTARRITQARESFQLSLRRLDGMGQAYSRTLESTANRHAAHSIHSILKRAYRENELDKMDEETAVNSLGIVLRMGGEFTFDHSARVLSLAMDLADEVGVNDARTRKQVRQGALLKDIGDVALKMGSQPEENLDRIGAFLSSQDLRRAGLLHDIGKTRIPKEILYKPGKLTTEEFEVMKLHPVLGEQIVFPISSLRHLCPTIRGHHERWDGKGYPDGLRGENIPLPARIIAVADVFDALAAPRPYKDGMEVNRVWRILQEGAGTHFDPSLVTAMGRVLRRRYPGVLED